MLILKKLFGKAIWIIFYILTNLSTIHIFAQDYPLAPEIWSEPVRLDSISQLFLGGAYPSLTQNLDTLYFYKNGEIYCSILMDNIWQEPHRLNNNVNNGTPSSSPSISKNGKRIYYSAWGGYGGWDLWYNDWDDSLKDWGLAKNMGPVINSSTYESYLYELSKDTVYTINFQWASDGPAKYVWNNSLQEWSVVDSFYYHHLGAGYLYGLSITKDRKKLYYGLRPWESKIRNIHGLELCVSYWDSTIQNWGDSYYLNINTDVFWPDTSLEYGFGGTDIYPWISSDGKVLFFQSNTESALRDTNNVPDLYMSYLLIDENGDTVTSFLQNHYRGIVEHMGLQQNYPNPFNPITNISYRVPSISKSNYKINLIVYDITGREVSVVFNGIQKSGFYELQFDAAKCGLSSGVYIYQIKIDDFIQAKKMLFLQ